MLLLRSKKRLLCLSFVMIMIYIFVQYRKSFKNLITYKPIIFHNLKLKTDLSHYEIYSVFSKVFDKVGNKSCIVKALSFKQILLIYGIDSDVKYGFRKSNSNLLGHAWVEVNCERLESKHDDNSYYHETIKKF